MERAIFVGRHGVYSHSHMYYHSVSAACHSDGSKGVMKESKESFIRTTIPLESKSPQSLCL